MGGSPGQGGLQNQIPKKGLSVYHQVELALGLLTDEEGHGGRQGTTSLILRLRHRAPCGVKAIRVQQGALGVGVRQVGQGGWALWL